MEHPSFSNIGVTPLSNALGAEIDGVDLSQPLEKAQFEDIQNALCAYGAIGFRNQKLSHQNQIDFALRFGTLEVHPIVKGMEEYPEIIRMHINLQGHPQVLGLAGTRIIHSLISRVLAQLSMQKQFRQSGDTLFANQQLAYDMLSDGIKETLDGLIAIPLQRKPIRHPQH